MTASDRPLTTSQTTRDTSGTMLSNPPVRRLALVVPALEELASSNDHDAAAARVDDVRRLLPDTDLAVVTFGASDALGATGTYVVRTSDRGAVALAVFAADVVVLAPGDASLVDLEAVFAHATAESLLDPMAVGSQFAAGLVCVAAVARRPVSVLDGGALTPWPAASDPAAALVDELEPAIRRQLWRRQADLEQQITRDADNVHQRDADVARLRNELALARAEARGRTAMEVELAEIKSSRSWQALDRYRLLRARARALRARQPWSPPPAEAPAPLGAPDVPAATHLDQHDVVCFSIIDWESRWQRPQQIVSKFADNGHRVFYVRMSGFLPPGGVPYELTELRDNVWSMTVSTRVHPQVYSEPIPPAVTAAYLDALEALRADHDVKLAVSLVQIPTWRPIVEQARDRFGWPVLYDCMDEWRGFPGVSDPVADEEVGLAAAADAVTVSARRLLEKFPALDRPAVLARNAADFDFFANAEPGTQLADAPRPVLGYFGVIDQWFDLELVEKLARARPDATIVLIGNAEVDVSPLERLPNVRLLGLRPYPEMPGYLAQFDVCLIPFRINETTVAADQVKFYEYISRGKPVVSTLLPELEQFREHLYLAADHEEFLAAVGAAAAEDDAVRGEQRVELARANDWQARYATMEHVIGEVLPMVSVVVVTYGNRELSEQCIERLLANTIQPRFEVIVVDNASDDGTPEYLHALAASDDRVHVILNSDNRGFAAAVNQGLAAARGDVLVIMNNDVVVPNAWHVPVLRHLEQPEVGLVTVTTNNAGNEARVAITYGDLDEMEAFAATRRRERDGCAFDVKVAVMYCLAMRRDVFEKIGPLDERFGIGWFEDDDYSHRARLAGYRVVCADDAYVHHHGQAAFNAQHPEALQALFDENQLRFEEKWGVRWERPAQGSE